MLDRRTVLNVHLIDTRRKWYPRIARPEWLPVAFVAGFGFERLLPRRHLLREASAMLADMIRFEQLGRNFMTMLSQDRRVYRPPGTASQPAEGATESEQV
ncbi:hypothetical protein K8B33_00710 [Alcanivorax sp. JB21]|uniref:hypothetical protein n=1 Tax=Alcanivorax limicola TaxID=2874102 RepID=UPI001CBB8D9B|nr:hypothetical protein [Alcanivorax limicola]MBZ2187605.1 hypothetical protein [Alcanivorax limicola]